MPPHSLRLRASLAAILLVLGLGLAGCAQGEEGGSQEAPPTTQQEDGGY